MKGIQHSPSGDNKHHAKRVQSEGKEAFICFIQMGIMVEGNGKEQPTGRVTTHARGWKMGNVSAQETR